MVELAGVAPASLIGSVRDAQPPPEVPARAAQVSQVGTPSRVVLPEGGFIGTTPALGDRDRMSLLLRKDPSNPNGHYAILSEYERLPVPTTEKYQITRWVPRMYAYYVESNGSDTHTVRPLRVGATGELEPDRSVVPSLLKTKSGSMKGAVLSRLDARGRTVERIELTGGASGSTWEPYIPGSYFRSKDSSGGDYRKDGVNTTFSEDGVVTFNSNELQGSYRVVEKAPGIFTLRATRADQPGREEVESKVLVFIDIVNWKPFKTTNEALLIDRDDPNDVGFFYERHDRDRFSFKSLWNLLTK